MNMKLKKLVKDLPNLQVKGSKEIEITGVCANSKCIAPGNLFVARKGHSDHGIAYIHEAIAAGAVALATDIYDPTLKDVAQIIYANTKNIESLLAAHYYQFPSHDLYMVGITGTNGKTTTSFYVKHLLDHLQSLCGVIGTIEYLVGQYRYRASQTTPDACTTQKLLREMLLQGCRAAVMEVSSHGLEQGRVGSIDYDAVIFTNLSAEHLDYHKSMENYAAAKQKLFSELNPVAKKEQHWPKCAIVNADSPWHKEMLRECRAPCIITYGTDQSADLKATNLQLTQEGIHFILHYNGEQVDSFIPMIGRHNVYNYMAACAVGLSRKVPLTQIVDIMCTLPAVTGRLEKVPNELGLHIYVDFAHKAEALQNVLQTLQELKQKRIIVVFGCGGDRDRGKRPVMAGICEQYADFAFVTSDNPRTEDPQAIIQEIISGFTKPQKFAVEVDRKQAIAKAIELAERGDIILIAGKGHESYQIFAHQTIEFNDCHIASELCMKRREAMLSEIL